MNYLDFEEGQLFIFIRDITDRKQPEEALRASEEKFRSIVENATDFIHIWLTLMTGYCPETICHQVFRERSRELIGKKVFDTFTKEMAVQF